jgi:hypothetical protein
VPTPADVTANPEWGVVSGSCCGVPQAGIVQQDVTDIAVEGDFAGHFFESGRYALCATEVASGHDSEEPVRR